MNDVIKNAREIITGYDGPKLRIMEVCGTHTHEIFRLGIRSLLPESIDLISGPGCPVCVTPVGYIDEAIYLALEKGCVICTFGDLIKVPGTKMSLGGARSEGADIRPVYSPDDLDKYEDVPEGAQCFVISTGTYYYYHKSATDFKRSRVNFMSEPITVLHNVTGGAGILATYAE